MFHKRVSAGVLICLLQAFVRGAQEFRGPTSTAADLRGSGSVFSNHTQGRSTIDIGPPLERVHESQQPPTGLAVDDNHNLYLVYPRFGGQNTPNNVAICTSFNREKPWPSAAIQNCTAGQDPSTCFVNVQNIVLDSVGQLWVLDSGIPYYATPGTITDAIFGGAKIMSYNQTGEHIRTYIIPEELLANGMNANDLRINNTLGYAFIADASLNSSLLAINLQDGTAMRRLFNTSFVRPDEGYVGSYNGRPFYSWLGTQKGYSTLGADGIALASGNLYWAVLASRRFYYVSQTTFINEADEQMLLEAVQDPGQSGSEQAGMTADDLGRVYLMASEQNAIFYVDTQASQAEKEVNGAPAYSDSLELVPAQNYVFETLVRSDLIQHADSAAILDGWLYFCTNQLWLGPGGQYNNTDNRQGPFASYRVSIGRGPAV